MKWLNLFWITVVIAFLCSYAPVWADVGMRKYCYQAPTICPKKQPYSCTRYASNGWSGWYWVRACSCGQLLRSSQWVQSWDVDERVLYCAATAGEKWRDPEHLQKWARWYRVSIERVRRLIQLYDAKKRTEKRASKHDAIPKDTR
jgi:hypothetical protein